MSKIENVNLKSEQALILANLNCINETIEKVSDLLKLNYSKFENKVLNVKLENFINNNVNFNTFKKLHYIKLYCVNCYEYYGKINNDKYQHIVYANNYYRYPEIYFELKDDGKRIDSNKLIESLKDYLNYLLNEKSKLEIKINNFEKNVNKLERLAKHLKKIKDGLSYEDRDYLKNNFYINL